MEIIELATKFSYLLLVTNKPLVNLHINPKSLNICKYEVHSLSPADIQSILNTVSIAMFWVKIGS